MFQRAVRVALRILDNRLLSRLRALVFLGTWGLGAVLIVVGVLLAIVTALTHVGVVSVAFIGIGLFVLIASGATSARRRLVTRRAQRHVASAAPTVASVWGVLAEVMDRGARVLSGRLGGGEQWATEAQAWISLAADAIADLAPPTEAGLFAVAGEHDHRLERQMADKVEYMRDRMQPKGMEGYWTADTKKIARWQRVLDALNTADALKEVRTAIERLNRERQLERAGVSPLKVCGVRCTNEDPVHGPTRERRASPERAVSARR